MLPKTWKRPTLTHMAAKRAIPQTALKQMVAAQKRLAKEREAVIKQRHAFSLGSPKGKALTRKIKLIDLKLRKISDTI